jgi:hypothetical protein
VIGKYEADGLVIFLIVLNIRFLFILPKKFDESVKNFVWRVNRNIYIIKNVNELQIENFRFRVT